MDDFKLSMKTYGKRFHNTYLYSGVVNVKGRKTLWNILFQPRPGFVYFTFNFNPLSVRLRVRLRDGKIKHVS